MTRKTLAFLTAFAVLSAVGYSQMIMESGWTTTVLAEENEIFDSENGDLNGDGLFNAGDALYFKKWMLGIEENELSVSAIGDINKDGVINIADFVKLKSMLLDTGAAKNPVELTTEIYGFDEGFETAGKENVIGVVTSDEELYDFLEKAQIDKDNIYDIYEPLGVTADFMPSESDYEKYVYIFCTSDGSAYHDPEAESLLTESSINITVTHYNNMNIKYLFRIEVPKEKYQNQTVKITDNPIEYAPGEPVPCKPVIYLYPEETMDINVRLHIKDLGNLTYTYPQYNRFTGWNVTADPDSVLHDASGREYSYLFWEGISSQKWDMSSGFVVKGTDTVRFLQEKLEYLGLTPREYNEFIVYWMPRMQDNKYNLISFQTEKYEEYAGLEITPKPDCIQRVFMAFKPLDQYTEIPEQKLESFERHGYSVIEWGGVEVTGDEYTVQ